MDKDLEKLKNNYLKKINGEKHLDQSIADIIEALKNGSCSVCSLPHYRYNTKKTIISNFEKIGWVERTGKTKVSVNFKATEEFKNIILNLGVIYG
jgi:hypothetical protein